MKVLVYGGKGWIGGMFVDLLKNENVSHTLGEVHCEDKVRLKQEIDTINPTHVISFIGRTHGEGIGTIDYLEKPGKLDINLRDNVFSPLLLAILCKERGIHFTYLGTGCIYDGYENEYTEEDVPNFKGSGYSTAKGYTDQLMDELSALNLRIRMPITSKKNNRNFITKITSYQKICSKLNSMTVLDDFLPIFLDMMRNRLTGTYNCTNPGAIEHNEILLMYREIVDNTFEWKNFSIEEQDKILLSKRSNNVLCTKKICELYPSLPHIKESIRSCLEAYV
jgi:dTDP-4-dehydrorhamnose reductase